jgi:hypothetical protein
VWEYPAFDDDSGVPKSLIMVVFPKLASIITVPKSPLKTATAPATSGMHPNTRSTTFGLTSASVDQLKDFNGQILNLGTTYTVGADDRDQWTSWSEVDEESQASSCTLSVDRMSEWQVGGDTFEVSVEPFGVGVAYEVHLPCGRPPKLFASTFPHARCLAAKPRSAFILMRLTGRQYNYQVTPICIGEKCYLVLTT